MDNGSVLGFFLHAGLMVKSVMLLLLGASILSWTFIFERGKFFQGLQGKLEKFENRFWSGTELRQLYDEIDQQETPLQAEASIFHAGFKEFSRLSAQPRANPESVMQGTERAMRIAMAREQDALEKHLSFLATVGSVSPYIGLFGTVWGIMTAFHALANVQQATISMVAPGISEALVATAMGLFAAIPAVIAYNRYSSSVDRVATQYETFLEEFSSILHRQAHA